MASTISLDEEVRLYTTNPEREKYGLLATLFGIIVALDYLERAYVRDSVTAAELRVGVPATVEHSSEAGPETGKWVAETTQSFITFMDALKLRMRAKDQLHPILQELVTGYARFKGSKDWEGRSKMVGWLITLNAMKASEEITEEQSRQLLFDIEHASDMYNNCTTGIWFILTLFKAATRLCKGLLSALAQIVFEEAVFGRFDREPSTCEDIRKWSSSTFIKSWSWLTAVHLILPAFYHGYGTLSSLQLAQHYKVGSATVVYNDRIGFGQTRLSPENLVGESNWISAAKGIAIELMPEELEERHSSWKKGTVRNTEDTSMHVKNATSDPQNLTIGMIKAIGSYGINLYEPTFLWKDVRPMTTVNALFDLTLYVVVTNEYKESQVIDKPFLPEDILWRQNLRKIPGAYTFNDMRRALLKPNAMRSTAVTYLEFKETEEGPEIRIEIG
ncbi:hypothetical protein EW026_g3532 [Hermanssonia centrifuga]|uniref:VPS28 C-terminal domain-containing protein n=1 Tax=Hermanssonia centrifuga TaxID=98765 RepID=A0A4S4KJT8_9APHY|nr:hypothetical protein EW026_g3532 [Hermanssonia centrifuga]